LDQHQYPSIENRASNIGFKFQLIIDEVYNKTLQIPKLSTMLAHCITINYVRKYKFMSVERLTI